MRIYIPTGLIVAAMVASGLYALRLGNAAERNAKVVSTLADGVNWTGEALGHLELLPWHDAVSCEAGVGHAGSLYQPDMDTCCGGGGA